jgi:Reverse transcriptase (RNA-dependent DNA polymerase)
VKPADQAHVSAVTDDAPQPARTLERAARAARLRDYFALQLHFAEVVAARAALPLADVVAPYTNFYRRFGFGFWHAPIALAWHGRKPSTRSCPPNAYRPAGSSLAALGAIPPMRTDGCAFTSRTMILTGPARSAGPRWRHDGRSCTRCSPTCSISNLEDKVVQLMMHRVLESIYEPLFLDCSYGFRPGRGCHEALRALHQHFYRKEVETIIDLDMANYFGTIDHGLLEAMLREKITDERFLRY